MFECLWSWILERLTELCGSSSDLDFKSDFSPNVENLDLDLALLFTDLNTSVALNWTSMNILDLR